MWVSGWAVTVRNKEIHSVGMMKLVHKVGEIAKEMASEKGLPRDIYANCARNGLRMHVHCHERLLKSHVNGWLFLSTNPNTWKWNSV